MCKVASDAATRALLVASSVVYCSICWVLKAPLSAILRARSALLVASLALAFASAKLACACAISAVMVVVENCANIWPFLTVSPVLTYTWFNNKPLTSAPINASCHGAILPLALKFWVIRCKLGLTILTVNADLAGVCAVLLAALLFVACPLTAPVACFLSVLLLVGFKINQAANTPMTIKIDQIWLAFSFIILTF